MRDAGLLSANVLVWNASTGIWVALGEFVAPPDGELSIPAPKALPKKTSRLSRWLSVAAAIVAIVLVTTFALGWPLIPAAAPLVPVAEPGVVTKRTTDTVEVSPSQSTEQSAAPQSTPDVSEAETAMGTAQSESAKQLDANQPAPETKQAQLKPMPVETWKQVVERITSEAALGDARAMAIRSIWMTLGLQPPDRTVALELAQSSIQQGCPLGQYAEASVVSLSGNAYEKYRKAFRGILQMANENDPFAQYLVATYYMFGLGGVERDMKRAGLYLKHSLKVGNQLEAQDLAAFFLLHAAKQPEKARQAYRKAADRGFPHAQLALSNLAASYVLGPAAFRPSNDEAEYWSNAAIANGYGVAIAKAGDRAYRPPNITEESLKERIRLYEKAAALNDATGLLGLGRAYLSGEGVPKDEAKGYALLERCVLSGTQNNTAQGADDSRAVEEAKRNLESRDALLAEKRRQEEDESERQNEQLRLLGLFTSRFARGKDNAYQYACPKVYGYEGKPLHEILAGSVQRLWTEKENLFLTLTYSAAPWDVGPMGERAPTHSNFHVRVSRRGSLAPVEGMSAQSGLVMMNEPVSLELASDEVENFAAVYQEFKKLSAKHGASESKPFKHVIKESFVFVWRGQAPALLAVRTPSGDTHFVDESFVDDMKYCLDQLPDMKKLLAAVQAAAISAKENEL